MSNDLCSPLQCNVCLMLRGYDHDKDTSMKQQAYQNLQSCSGCQLVKYCNKSHQKQDWPIHKDFCQAVQKIKQISKVTHPFYIAGQPPRSKEDVEKAIVEVKFLLKHSLGRPLEHQEEELTSFPAYCPVCFKFKNLKVICPECLNQAYCTEEHRQSHSVEHQQDCALLQLYYCPYKVVPTMQDMPIRLSQRISDLKKMDLVEAIDYAWNLKLPLYPCKSLLDYLDFANAADFSCMMSICYGLCHVEMENLKTSKFSIFIIGASAEPVLWFHEIHCKFLFLQHPELKELELYFIGPEVSEPANSIIKFDFLGYERTVNFHIYKGLFQDYCKHHQITPSLIVAFNCGFSEYTPSYNATPKITNLNALDSLDSSSKNTWRAGIVEILQTFETPILFTSFTQQESEFDFAALLAVAIEQQLKVRIERLFKVAKNPYHDLRPLRQWYSRDKESFYYRNGYIQAIRTKLEQ